MLSCGQDVVAGVGCKPPTKGKTKEQLIRELTEAARKQGLLKGQPKARLSFSEYGVGR